jgi:hypothetical protein
LIALETVDSSEPTKNGKGAEVPINRMYWYKNLTHRDIDGAVVPGVYFLAFIHNGDYYLTSIVAYQDGMVDCWGLVSFEEFRTKVQQGWVVTSVPDGATVCIHHLVRFTARDVFVEGPESEFVKDVANAIEELNGRPTAQARLIDAIAGLRERDTPELRLQLRQAYADLPAYCRKYIFGSRMEKRKDIQRLLEAEE